MNRRARAVFDALHIVCVGWAGCAERLGTRERGGQWPAPCLNGMAAGGAPAVHNRVLERRAVALTCHYREFEVLSIRQIAERLGRSPATIKA